MLTQGYSLFHFAQRVARPESANGVAEVQSTPFLTSERHVPQLKSE